MDIAETRDLILCISFGLMVVVLVLINILGFLLYRKVRSVTASVQSVIDVTKQIITKTAQAVNSAKEMGRMINKQEIGKDKVQQENLSIKK